MTRNLKGISGMTIDWLVIQNQALALVFNVLSWALSFLPAFLKPRPPPLVSLTSHRCVRISGPGGTDRLQV